VGSRAWSWCNLYKDNVVDIGGSDTAFMSWIAEEDKNRKKS